MRSSGLDYTIIHPGRLTNDKGSGKISIGKDLEIGDIPREDVARVIVASLENESTIGKEFQVTLGNLSVYEAIKSI